MVEAKQRYDEGTKENKEHIIALIIQRKMIDKKEEQEEENEYEIDVSKMTKKQRHDHLKTFHKKTLVNRLKRRAIYKELRKYELDYWIKKDIKGHGLDPTPEEIGKAVFDTTNTLNKSLRQLIKIHEEQPIPLILRKHKSCRHHKLWDDEEEKEKQSFTEKALDPTWRESQFAKWAHHQVIFGLEHFF